MKAKWLLGIGTAAAGAAAVCANKLLSKDQKEELTAKADETMLNTRQTALKYYRYLQDYLKNNPQNLDLAAWTKDKLGAAKEKLADNDNVSETLASLKQSTADLKDKLNEMRADENKDEDTDNLQDDIVVDSSIFNDQDDDQPKVQVFYPHNNK